MDENGNIVRDRKGRPKFVGDSLWPEMLKTEIFDFVSKCRDSYERLCPTRRDIILPDSVLESLEEMRDTDLDDYESIFHKHFEITGNDEDYVLLDTVRKVVRTDIEENHKGQGLSWEGFAEFMRKSLSIDQPAQPRFLNRQRAYLHLPRGRAAPLGVGVVAVPTPTHTVDAAKFFLKSVSAPKSIFHDFDPNLSHLHLHPLTLFE